MNSYQNIINEFNIKLQNIFEIHDLIHILKPEYYGKDGIITNLLSNIKNMSIDDKKIAGKNINEINKYITNRINEKEIELKKQEIEKKLLSEEIDGTISCRKNYISQEFGALHILTKGMNEAIKILEKYGFSFVSGPEIEEDFFNFTALNIPKYHPARQMQDTFYMNGCNDLGENYILRTHTTCVDIRNILSNNKKPPIALLSAGKVFRVESDKTHSPMFHQIEAVMIDEKSKLNMQHLRFYLEEFLKEFFETDNIVLKFRPSFFPFTTPSAEVDIGYNIINEKIVIGGDEKFLEFCGSGMLHPNVLKNLNIDPEIYQGIAFGGGLDRLVMLKYGIKDVRKIFENNAKWIRHYV